MTIVTQDQDVTKYGNKFQTNIKKLILFLNIDPSSMPVLGSPLVFSDTQIFLPCQSGHLVAVNLPSKFNYKKYLILTFYIQIQFSILSR